MQTIIRFVAGVFVAGGVVAGGTALPQVTLRGHGSTEVRSNVAVATPGLPSLSGAAVQAHGTASAAVDTGSDAVARAAAKLRAQAQQVAAAGRTAAEGAVSIVPPPSTATRGTLELGTQTGAGTAGLSAGTSGHASLTTGLPTIKAEGGAAAGLTAGATLTGKLR